MKRSVLVAAGTAVGVTAVVSYHAAGPSVSSSLVASSSPAGGASGGRSTSTRTSRTTTSPAASATSSTTASSTSSGTRSARSQVVSFPYGELQVKVTERGHRITDVAVTRLSVPEPQSGSIDQFAVPQLRQEVLAAQSAHINGVSGASYTSQAYAQSVQSALDKLP